MATLTYQEFKAAIRAAEPRFAQQWLNTNQDTAVSASLFPPMFIVAGPGTGKTTVLALRALKHIFVDGLLPETIIATTFTKKAAKELRSRILSWGVSLHQEVLKQAESTHNTLRINWLKSLDINGVQTGTLDSLAEEMIENDRQPGEITPTVIENFMATGLMRRHIMYHNQRYNDPVLEDHLRSFNSAFPGVKGFSEKLKICLAFAERAIHDQIDLQKYATYSAGHRLLAEIVQDYHKYLQDSQLMDFALLENEIFERLKSGRLVPTIQKLKALLVDEFQDTNYLQEQIYYELCRRSGACLTVVGDDDQSIFRFRGATVEIFSNFAHRLSATLGQNWQPVRVNLTENYRSTERIVSFFNHFITSEPDFSAARTPGKYAGVPAAPWANNSIVNIPVLGLFREDIHELSVDLCQFLGDIFCTNGKGWSKSVAGGTQPLSIQPSVDGDFGDAVFLAWKVGERNYNGEPRLPLLLRQELTQKYNVDVFNPRGRVLASIPEVAQCLGLMLECIDPNGQIQNSIKSMRLGIVNYLNEWRIAAKQFIALNPNPGGLGQFISDWGSRTTSIMNTWPKEWPLLELMFTIITWVPFFHTNPEGQVYLEAMSRAISEAGQIASYHSLIFTGGSFDAKAVSEAIREVFEPIASGDVSVDEEIMPYIPRSHFPIMTIHQAKGLEFPLVILDIGSDFRTNHHTQRKFRYPDQGSSEHLTEDHTAAFSPVGPARMLRTGRQRAFDDIRRLYYVAKSRPQNALILVGLTSQLKQGKSGFKIPSITTGDLTISSRSYNFTPANLWTPMSTANTIVLI